MNEVFIYAALIIFGATFGSYGAATVWRLRARQLAADKKAGEDYDKKEYKRLKKIISTPLQDHSQCLHCDYMLKWYDLIPVVSWLSLKGKCRNCRKPIGWFEFVMEIGVAAFFVLSYILWPNALTIGLDNGLEIAHFVLWLAAGVVMAILFAYDAKWFLLPNRLSLALSVIGAGIVGITIAQTGDVTGTLLSALGSVAALAGVYGLLYVVSKGRWVGFGDVKLGVGLGLVLVDLPLAIAALFLANFIGCLIVIPLMASKKLKRTSHVPFGPMLIGGMVVAWFFGSAITNWYLTGLGF
jgi:leader peptidase (prepilin peptidase)/N-methyltransferase